MTKETRTMKVRTIPCSMLLFLTVLLLGQLGSTAQTPSTGPQTDVDNEYQTAAILWTQSSAEYRALAYQTFVFARLRLDEDLRGPDFRRNTRPSPRAAVIVAAVRAVFDNGA